MRLQYNGPTAVTLPDPINVTVAAAGIVELPLQYLGAFNDFNNQQATMGLHPTPDDWEVEPGLDVSGHQAAAAEGASEPAAEPAHATRRAHEAQETSRGES
jgi:hypothetical protein